jgi:subtilisin family serine protease
VLVRFSTPDRKAGIDQVGVSVTAQRDVDGTDFTELSIAPGSAGVALDVLRHSPGIAEAEPNVVLRSQGGAIPFDADPYPQPFPGIAANDVGSDDQTLAVVDTGVDGTHPDLAGRVLAGYNAITGSSSARTTTDTARWSRG